MSNLRESLRSRLLAIADVLASPLEIQRLSPSQRIGAAGTGILGGVLLSMVFMATHAFAASAQLAAHEPAAIAAAELAEDKGHLRKPLVFTPDRRNPEIETLKAEVQRLRAQADMCAADAQRVAKAK